MSAVGNKLALGRLCAKLRERGCRNIRALKINVNDPGWDRDKQRIWSLKHLVREFGLRKPSGFSDWESEYLMENSIRPGAIKTILTLREMDRMTPLDLSLNQSDASLEQKWVERRNKRKQYTVVWRENKGTEQGTVEQGSRKRARGFGKTLVIGSRR
ncbi:hypothetical protein OQA88_9533 [Cercophora sp. LCS_1]